MYLMHIIYLQFMQNINNLLFCCTLTYLTINEIQTLGCFSHWTTIKATTIKKIYNRTL